MGSTPRRSRHPSTIATHVFLLGRQHCSCRCSRCSTSWPAASSPCHFVGEADEIGQRRRAEKTANASVRQVIRAVQLTRRCVSASDAPSADRLLRSTAATGRDPVETELDRTTRAYAALTPPSAGQHPSGRTPNVSTNDWMARAMCQRARSSPPGYSRSAGRSSAGSDSPRAPEIEHQWQDRMPVQGVTDSSTCPPASVRR